VSSVHQRNDPSGQAPPQLVLIAEDEEPIALALAEVIEAFGYRTLIAQNGKLALELAHAHHPALIMAHPSIWGIVPDCNDNTGQREDKEEKSVLVGLGAVSQY
jgi:hypothetical protein